MATAGVPAGPTASAAPVEARPRRRRRVLVAGAVLLALLLAWAGWVAWRGTQVVGALEGALPVVDQVEAAVRDGDVERALGLLPQLQERADRAVGATSDPGWRLAEHLPVVGDDLRAVRAVANAYALVATEVLPPLAQVAGSLRVHALAPTDGRIDLAPLQAAVPRVRVAADGAVAAAAMVEDVADGALLGPVAARVAQAQDALDGAARTLTGAGDVLAVLPGLLGADGERTYLVLMLNSAELRTLGGLAGAGAVLRVADGAITLDDHRATPDLRPLPEPVVPVTDDEVEVHTERFGRYFQNTTSTPHFPRAAELAAALWERHTGDAVDGVLALDALALAHLLGAVGPVTEPTGITLDQAGVVEELLLRTYRRHPVPEDADAFHAGVTGAVLDGLLAGGAGGADSGRLVAALGRAAEEGRVLVWSADPAEQEVLAGSVAGGAFLGGGDAATAAGVFLDDVTGTKLGYFLDVEVEAAPARCVDRPDLDEPAVTVVTLRMTSGVPDVATLPDYVSGVGFAQAPGRLRTNVTVYAPVGGAVVGVWRGGAQVGGREATLAGRDVVVVTSDLGPGDAEVYRIAVRGGGGPPSTVWSTPTITNERTVPNITC